jgi:hypothetical protein
MKNITAYLDGLDYKRIPYMNDIETTSENISHKGYTIRGIGADIREVTNKHNLFSKLYELKVIYRTTDSDSYDNCFDEFVETCQGMNVLPEFAGYERLEFNKLNVNNKSIGTLIFYNEYRGC